MFRKSQCTYSRINEKDTFSTAPISRLRLCFETLPDGRIPIINDIDHVMRCLTMFPSLCVQAEHVYGRLSVLLGREEFRSNFVAPLLNEEVFCSLFKAKPAEIWAELKTCKCCDSPGNLSFYNCYGARFFQISAPHDVEPREWANFLSMVAVKPSKLPDSPAVCDSSERHPVAPNEAEEIHLSKWAFFKFLEGLAKSEECLQFTLPCADMSFKRSFYIYEIFEDGGTLICRGENVGLSLTAIRSFALNPNKATESLLCLGAEQSVLMEISLPDNLKSTEHWNQAVRALRESAF